MMKTTVESGRQFEISDAFALLLRIRSIEKYEVDVSKPCILHFIFTIILPVSNTFMKAT
jgi:hypothetical protein